MTDDTTPTDTPTESSDDTVQFNVEIPARLRQKWKNAVKQKHGKYRGASKDEAHRMIEAWADAILDDTTDNTPEPSNRDVLDTLTRRIDELEQRLDETVAATPSDADRQIKNNPTSEQPSDSDEFWSAYDPDSDRDEPIPTEYLREVDDLSYPKINRDHLDEGRDGYFPGNTDTRAAIIAAVLRHELNKVVTGEVMGRVHDILGNDTAGYIKRTYVPAVTEDFIPDPDEDGVWYTSQGAYDAIMDEYLNKVPVLKDQAVAVVCADTTEELSDRAERINISEPSESDAVQQVRERVFEPNTDDIKDALQLEEYHIEFFRTVFHEVETALDRTLWHGTVTIDGETYTSADEYLAARPSTMGEWRELYEVGRVGVEDQNGRDTKDDVDEPSTATETETESEEERPTADASMDGDGGEHASDDGGGDRDASPLSESEISVFDAEPVTDDADDDVRGRIEYDPDGDASQQDDGSL